MGAEAATISFGKCVIAHQEEYPPYDVPVMPILPGCCDPCLDQRFDAGADVFLFAASPAVFQDGQLEGKAVTGAAAVIRVEHVEALAGEKLDLRVEIIGAVVGRSAMDVDDRSTRWSGRAIQPGVDFQSVHGTPAEIFGRSQLFSALKRCAPIAG